MPDSTINLTATQARQIAVRAQLLDEPRPATLLDTVERLSMVQIDQVTAVAPSHELVMWSRLGSSYRLNAVERAVDDGRLVNLRGMIRPAADVALYLADMAAWPGPDPQPWQDRNARWVAANEAGRRAVLDALRSDGPLATRELPDRCEKPWKSSGWNSGRNVTMLVEMMEQRGEVAAAGRRGRDRLWDLAERIYPDVPAIPAAEARQRRDAKRLRALGIARPTGPDCPVELQDVGDAGVAATVEGTRGLWRVDPRQAERLDEPFVGRAAILSPLDRLLFDRKRMVDLFAFDYQLEMYKPAAKRRWGYYALPILWGPDLVGKLDATADRDQGVLWIDAIHRDVEFDEEMTAAVEAEIDSLATWLGLAPRQSS